MDTPIDPATLSNRASIRDDLKPAIAEFMETEYRQDFSDAVCALVVRGIRAWRGNQTESQAPVMRSNHPT